MTIRKSKAPRRSYVEDENGNIVQVDKIKKKRRTTLTRPHRIALRVVESLGLTWEDEKQFGRFNIDIYIPDLKLAVEVDGNFWHQLPGVPEKDARRDRELFVKHGIVTVRFWESDIYENHHKMEKKLKKVVSNIDKLRQKFKEKYED